MEGLLHYGESERIVPIQHAGFKHFVVLRTIRDGRVYMADPAVGNLSFTLAQFEEKWDDNVLFIVCPSSDKPLDNLELKEEDLRFIDEQTLTLLALERMPDLHESTTRRIQNVLERQKNNPDGSVENARKRWMLIFTRDEDLEGQTVIETDRGPQKIPHVSTGEFGLTTVKAR